MKICSIASGSKGNCSIIQTDGTCVLVDCGLPVREVEARLKSSGFLPERVEAIFLTHEHVDHVSGVVAFCSKYGTLLFLHKKVFYRFSYMFEKIKDKIRIFDFTDFYFQDLTVSPFELSHDSECCTGFSFYNIGKKVSFATDTGYISAESLQKMEQSDIVFLESNHDSHMLVVGPYPARLKKRIASEEGHLSNDLAAKYACELARKGTKIFVLSHLSETNNLPEKAFQTVSDALCTSGFSCKVIVAKQAGLPDIFEL